MTAKKTWMNISKNDDFGLKQISVIVIHEIQSTKVYNMKLNSSRKNTLIHQEKETVVRYKRHHFCCFYWQGNGLVCIRLSVGNHTLSLFNKAIASPIFIRLQTFLHSFPLLDCFPLPPNQIRVGREIWKRGPASHGIC